MALQESSEKCAVVSRSAVVVRHVPKMSLPIRIHPFLRPPGAAPYHRINERTPLRKAGEGFLRTEGALADDTEWDAIMEEIYQARRRDRRPESPDLGEP